jgi:thiol-disulfide isomerase/thioredoxin
MSSTVNLILTYVRAYYFRIMIAFLVGFFIIAGYYGYKKMYPVVNNTNKFKDVANALPHNKEIVVTMYHVDWCPHCKKAMPEWSGFVSEYNNKMVNGYKIICVDLDCTDNKNIKIKNILEKDPAIDSFPTVRAVMPKDGGKEITIQFKSRIAKDNLEKFVLSISSPK